MSDIGARIRLLRKDKGLTAKQFGERIGISDAAVSQIENGKSGISDRTVRDICRVFSVNETWLRTGDGDMHAALGREAELAELVKSLMADKSESLRWSLITTLLRFEPDGDEWKALERIYDGVAEQYRQK